MTGDTIFALASGAGRSAVAIVRLSGPAAGDAVVRMTGALPAPRRAVLTPIRHPDAGIVLDRGLALWFPGPGSFTGEDCAEFHLHGSRAVIASVLEALGSLAGMRPAEPGEFTRRAFLNGKLDLAAVEGLADLIDAETEAQRKQALHQLDGALGRWVEGMREGLLDALALAESAIDFADEGDVAGSALADALHRAAGVALTIRRELEIPQSGERVRDGFVVALAGPPNSGKSTLLNTLARREAAIVSPYPGTTRDPIAIDLNLAGYAVVLVDTAGIRETEDPVEREGVARARARAGGADLVLWLQDAATVPTPPAGLGQVWSIGTKADLLGADKAETGRFDYVLSARSGLGVEALVDRLKSHIGNALVGGEAALVTRLRHRAALEGAEAALSRLPQHSSDPELVAEELRTACARLGRITGRIDVEEVLGAIFSRFCIGK